MKASMLAVADYRLPEVGGARGGPGAVPRSAVDPALARQSFEHGLEQAELADQAGFDWVSVSEHHSSTQTLTPNAAVWGAAVAQRVRRATIAYLGPVLPLGNPIRIAEEIAMLDMLTGGRTVACFLRGVEREFPLFDVDPVASRGITREAADLITKALTEPEPFAWEGSHFRYPCVSVWPPTIQRPHPPLYLSGNSIESAAFAGSRRHGLGISFTTMPSIPLLVEAYRSAALRAGWEPSRDQVIFRCFCVIEETDVAARERARTFFHSEAALRANPDLGAPIVVDPSPTTPQHDLRVMICGSPATLLDQIRTLHTIGVGVLDLVFKSQQTDHEVAMRSIDLFARKVLPALRALG